MDHLTLVQGSEEWRRERCGSLGASRLHEAIAKIKSGWGASRANLMAELIAERLTRVPAEKFITAAMQWGIDNEAEARDAYCFRADANVTEIGLATHPTIIGTHASPDGLVGSDGVLEIKCPIVATHLETLLGGGVDKKYLVQMQWQMVCTGRQWCDFVSYDPRLPEEMRLFVERVPRDNVFVASLEADVRAFLIELDDKVIALRARYATKAAA